MATKITKSELKDMIREAVLKEQSSRPDGILNHFEIKLKQLEEEIRTARYNASPQGRSRNFDVDKKALAADYQESVSRIKKALNYMQMLVTELEQL
jgi:hypothetical protein